MELKFYNTLSRCKQVFVPIDSKNVRMYVCGPTVYDYAHIGNARPVIIFDVLFRLLREVYGKNSVTYVRNITDVDDKINAKAKTKGVSISEITAKTTKQFHSDIAAIGVLPPTIEPKATAHITEMIEIIKTLMNNGNAYYEQGHVLFSVASMPEYGSLAKRSKDEMLTGARVEVAPYKKDPLDFVLWKPSVGDDPGWDSPWGYGRPGWHIECSAMSKTHLGDVFDIHGGGIDLVFPHHENEIAQSCCASKQKMMANYWLHNGYLQVEGQKMSKSLGNFLTINYLLQSWPGEVLRLTMLMTHYRQPIDWIQKRLHEAKQILHKWYNIIENAKVNMVENLPNSNIKEQFLSALADDLNTPAAIAEMHKLAMHAANDTIYAANLLACGQLLGIFNDNAASFAAQVEISDETRKKIDGLVAKRNRAREERDWVTADAIRDKLISMNVIINDKSEEGSSWEIIDNMGQGVK